MSNVAGTSSAKLSVLHQRMIEASSISAEVAAQRGYETVWKQSGLERLGFGRKQCRVPALLIPIYGVYGEIVLYQARPDQPRANPKGKAIKYETPGGSRMAIDVPPSIRAKLGDPNLPLWITEGVRKADAAVTHGLVCIALLGVYNWRGTNGEGGKVALPDWESIALNERKVFIAFDSDVMTKPEVQSALSRLSAFLERRGADARQVLLPPGESGAKVGLDDFFAAGHSVQDLLGCVGRAPMHSDGSSEARYEARGDGLIWNKETRHGTVPTPLTNFTALITREVLHDDGAECSRMFEIEAHLGGRASTFQVPAFRFHSMGWPTENLGAEAIIYPGQSARDHAGVAIQELSGRVPKKTVYTHTGWRQVGDRMMYLHGDGAIGPQGMSAEVQVALPSNLAPFRLPPPPSGDELQDAIRASLSILSLAPDRITIPVLAATYRSVLGATDLSVHLVGKTGAGKSELAARGMQHFGPGFDREGLPASWTSTANSLEALAFDAKDALLVVDDFCPTGALSDIQRANRDADRVLRAQGNRSGRGRLGPDGRPRTVKSPRGLLLSTGEEVPRGHSLRARMLVVEVPQGVVDFEALTDAQTQGAAGVFARAMAGYLAWIAPQHAAITAKLAEEIRRRRERFSQDGYHRRTPSIAAELHFGLETFLNFAEDAGAITPIEADRLLGRAHFALVDLANAQAEHHAASEPTSRFLELLRSSLASGRAYVAAIDGGHPAQPGPWGWREHVVGSGVNVREEWQPQGSRIGWLDATGLYVDREAAYRAAQEMAGYGGDAVSVSSQTLVKRLFEQGMLASTDTERNTLSIRKVIGGKRQYVLHFLPATVLPDSDDPEDSDDARSSDLAIAADGDFR